MNANVKLRAPEPDDVDFMYRMECLPDVALVSASDGPASRYLLWKYVESYTADIYRDRQLRLIVECDGEPAGTIDVYDFNPAHMHAWVGIAIASRYRCCGVGSRALELLVEYLWAQFGIKSLAAMVHADNEASLSLFRSAGFVDAGMLHSWLRRGSRRGDAVILQLLLPKM